MNKSFNIDPNTGIDPRTPDLYRKMPLLTESQKERLVNLYPQYFADMREYFRTDGETPECTVMTFLLLAVKVLRGEEDFNSVFGWSTVADQVRKVLWDSKS